MSDNKSLLALVQESNDLEKKLIEAGGELTPELEAALEVKEIQLPEKVDGYNAIIDRFEWIKKSYKERADFFLGLAKSSQSLIDRLESNLKIAMQAAGVDEIEGVDYRFKLQKSPPSVVIEDEAKVDGAYKVTETITKIDKKRMAEDLKLGIPVEGAKLNQGSYVKAYSNNPARRKSK
jgi:hypothetical protein